VFFIRKIEGSQSDSERKNEAGGEKKIQYSTVSVNSDWRKGGWKDSDEQGPVLISCPSKTRRARRAEGEAMGKKSR